MNLDRSRNHYRARKNASWAGRQEVEWAMLKHRAFAGGGQLPLSGYWVLSTQYSVLST